MAKQTEEVEVKFTADTKEYEESVEKSEASTTNFAASVGTLATVTVGAGAAFLKLNPVLKLFNIHQLLGIKNLTLINLSFGTMFKWIWKLIPAFIRLRAAMFATGIGALVIALVALFSALKNTAGGSDFLATVMRTLGNVVSGVVEIFTGLGKALVGLFSGDWALATEGFAQAWEGVAEGIGNSISNAKAYVIIQRAIADSNSTLALQAAQRQSALNSVNLALAVENKSLILSEILLKRKAEIQQGLVTDQITSLNLAQAELKSDLAKATSDKSRLELQKSINDLDAQRIGLLGEGKAIELELEVGLGDARQTEADRLAVIEQERIDAIDARFLAEVTAANQLTAFQKFQLDAQTMNKADNDKQQAEFTKEVNEELNKELVDKNKKTQEQITKDTEAQLQRRIEETQLNEDAKGSLINSGFQLAQIAAKENQQVQGAIMIAQAIANTALGVSGALKLPYVAPFVIPAIIAAGAVQVAAIAAQMGVSGGGGASNSLGAIDTEQRDVETESAFVSTEPQFIPVLVTEDLDKVQQGVRVTNDRASLG